MKMDDNANVKEETVLAVIRDQEDQFDQINPENISDACFDRIIEDFKGYGKQGQTAITLMNLARDIVYSF